MWLCRGSNSSSSKKKKGKVFLKEVLNINLKVIFLNIPPSFRKLLDPSHSISPTPQMNKSNNKQNLA